MHHLRISMQDLDARDTNQTDLVSPAVRLMTIAPENSSAHACPQYVAHWEATGTRIAEALCRDTALRAMADGDDERTVMVAVDDSPVSRGRVPPAVTVPHERC